MTLVNASYLVIDASVLVELVIKDRWHEGAAALRRIFQSRSAPALVTSGHGPLEALNALKKIVNRGKIELSDATLALDHLLRLRLTIDIPSKRLRRIWQLRENMTPYDAAYAAAAEAYSSPLLTTDRKLIKACEAASINAIHLSQLA